MNIDHHTLELLTPCFCGGANPHETAEIRAPSIRGQLRWWFRTLGGFDSLDTDLRTQEASIFGSTAEGAGEASKLLVRVSPLVSQTPPRDADQMETQIPSDKGYLLFPLRSNLAKNEYKGRGVLMGGSFELTIQWRGPSERWQDIQALCSVLGHLGSLGFRSRRGFGALSFSGKSPPLCDALTRFRGSKEAIVIQKLSPARSTDDALNQLGKWLKGWRSHGRSQDHSNAGNDQPPRNSGFAYAKADHDAGYGINRDGETYRAALGLPIVQRCGNTTHNWEFGTNGDRGRFASPVILRPYRTSKGTIEAWIIFVDAHAWTDDRPVYLDGTPRRVSTALYDAMRNDTKLTMVYPE